MPVTREEFLKRLLNGYSRSYDIEFVQHNELPLVATAQFHVSESQYILSKKATMWTVDSDEYVYFFSVPELTEDIYSRCIQYACDNGMAKIDLTTKQPHMCTRLVALFLCDSADAAALIRLKKCRIYKSFQFSFKGWMEFHTAAADLGKESVVSNNYGRDTAKFMKNALNPPVGRRGDYRRNFLSRLFQKRKGV